MEIEFVITNMKKLLALLLLSPLVVSEEIYLACATQNETFSGLGEATKYNGDINFTLIINSVDKTLDIYNSNEGNATKVKYKQKDKQNIFFYSQIEVSKDKTEVMTADYFLNRYTGDFRKENNIYELPSGNLSRNWSIERGFCKQKEAVF